jgi:hypothetical protein
MERFSCQIVCDSFLVEGFLYPPLPEAVASFLELMELCKGLVVIPFLLTLIVFLRNLRQIRDHELWVKMHKLCRV